MKNDNSVSGKKKSRITSFRIGFIGFREIVGVIVLALIILLFICDKPYDNKDLFFWKPMFWSVTTFEDSSYLVKIPAAGSKENAADLDKVAIKDVSEKLEVYASPKEYIESRISKEMDDADSYTEGISELFELIEVGYLNMPAGEEAFYMIYTPGGEYSGNKILEVAIKKGDRMFSASYRSRWTSFSNNYSKALGLIKSIRIKNKT